MHYQFFKKIIQSKYLFLSFFLLISPILLVWSVQADNTSTQTSSSNSILDADGKTPLINAIDKNDMETLEKLLKSSADANDKGKQDLTPLIWAVTRNREEMVKRLLYYGADPNAPSTDGSTPLIFSVQYSYKNMTEILLKHGANPDQEDAKKLSPLIVALQCKNEEITDLLLKSSSKRNQVPRKLPPTCSYPVNLSQSWSIATYRLLDELNHQNCFCLGGNDRFKKEGAKKLLDRWWNITDRKSTLKILDWLLTEGHRSKFNQMHQWLSPMSPTEFERELSRLNGNLDMKEKIKIVWSEGKNTGDKSIIGWDLVRYIWVASRAYAAGYLTEKEAWEKIAPVACRLQQAFSSWDEMENNYLIGRKFWSGSRPEDNKKMESKKVELLKPRNYSSPWISIPWNTSLECD
jgi:hypothetical protein